MHQIVTIQFIFDNNIYVLCDGAAIGSPLGSSLANIFMSSSCLCNCAWYFDDTHVYIEPVWRKTMKYIFLKYALKDWCLIEKIQILIFISTEMHMHQQNGK